MTRRIEKRLKLKPVAYFVKPFEFGRVRDATTRMPNGGNEYSRRIALFQHRLFCHWFRLKNRTSAAQLCIGWEFSRSNFSRWRTGQQWLSLGVVAALGEDTDKEFPQAA